MFRVPLFVMSCPRSYLQSRPSMHGVVVVHLSCNDGSFGLRFRERTDGQGHMIAHVLKDSEAHRRGT